jgi:thioredoxin-related protein
VYFNSDCDYCQSEATKIEERLGHFKEVQLVFVSFEEQKNIIDFAKEYKLYKKENVVFLEDKEMVFSQIFDVNSIPYIVVYDKDKNFLQKFKGATKIDNILAVLN